ncbi:MAG: DUF3616 domain-containing protein [Nitrosomonas sp.]|nr:DUF3616 domain-containing protein [Nitrosomonas sp.]
MNIKLPTVVITVIALILTPLGTADTLSPITRHFGMCDASAAVPVAPDLFVIANDEDNTLRIFQRNKSGVSLYSQDISSFLQIDPKHPEADIEGATLIKNRIYWITSHGSNKDGKKRPNRHRFFATEIETIDGQFNLKPIGKPFVGLVKALEDSAGLKDYHLGKAAKHAPESRNGLNIEGLTKTPQGHLLIGFRNPIPQGKALLVPLENPQAVIAGHEKPKLGNPIFLALNGLGIRSIEYSDTKGAYFIIAGPYDDNGRFQLYQWSGNPFETPELIKMDFHKLRPEALVVYPQQKAKIQIISDDGSESINNQNCKGLAKVQDKSFRSIWVDMAH